MKKTIRTKVDSTKDHIFMEENITITKISSNDGELVGMIEV